MTTTKTYGYKDVFWTMAHKSNIGDIKRGRKNKNPITRADVFEAYEKMDGCCCYCSCELIGIKTKVNRRSTPDAITIERIDNALPHTVGNITVACHSCNVTRGSTIPYQVMLDYGHMIKDRTVKWCSRCEDVCSIDKFNRRYDRPAGNYQALCKYHDRKKAAARRAKIKNKRKKLF